MRIMLLATLFVLTLARGAIARELPPEAYQKNDDTQDSNALVAKARELIELIKIDTAGRIWTYSAMLGGIGTVATDELTNALTKTTGVKRIAIASALIQTGAPEKGAKSILQSIADAKSRDTKMLGLRALSLAEVLLSVEDILDSLSIMFGSEQDQELRIAYADTILKLSSKWGEKTGSSRLGKYRTEAIKFLEESTKTSDDKVVREAALILGENGLAYMAQGLLKGLSLEPTTEGRRARLILNGINPKWAAVLQEIALTIQDGYVDAEEVDTEKLFEHAARGMVRSLDDYSDYLSKDDVTKMEERLTNAYEGIGAYISVINEQLTIDSPIYSGPAHRAGLRSGDAVIEVNGQSTEGEGLEKSISLIKGPRGTIVTLKIMRNGWNAPQNIKIIRERIIVKSVYQELLSGGIGYIRLTRFGDDAGRDIYRAISKLTKKGARAFILDLRDNGGGLLNEAVNVSDVFLTSGKAIVYSQGRSGYSPLKRFYSATTDLTDGLPLTVLINAGTASASEIVTGALQDWGRAVVIGEESYGKGSVQSLIPVRQTANATRIRMTIARYYLPSGRPITRSQPITPDIEIPYDGFKAWEVEEIITLGLESKIDSLLRDVLSKNKKAVQHIAESFELKLSDIPGLETLAIRLGTKISHASLILLARRSARSLSADLRGSKYITDMLEDKVLRRGIYEIISRFEGQDNLPAECRAIITEFNRP